jgi:hypothetical protein
LSVSKFEELALNKVPETKGASSLGDWERGCTCWFSFVGEIRTTVPTQLGVECKKNVATPILEHKRLPRVEDFQNGGATQFQGINTMVPRHFREYSVECKNNVATPILVHIKLPCVEDIQSGGAVQFKGIKD